MTVGLLLLLAACGPKTPPRHGTPEGAGPLVLAGGGSLPTEVIERSIALAGGPRAKIVVLPQASTTESAGSAARKRFEDNGALDVTVWRFAGSPGTDGLEGPFPSVEETAAAIAEADLIWFTGGQQRRIMNALTAHELDDDVVRRWTAGALVGGASAGAAVVGEVMITGAEYDLKAVTTGSTHTAPGLGLLPDVIIDQHFVERQRQTRLLTSVLEDPDRIGVGIDEDTAIIVRGDRFEVLGSSVVVVFDAREAEVVETDPGSPAAATDIELHVLRPGMSHRFRDR